MADDWQDLEFLRHVFDETQVVRKPLTGIITGYHVLPYILVAPEHDHPARAVEVRGRIRVSRIRRHAGGRDDAADQGVLRRHLVLSQPRYDLFAESS